MRMLVAAAGVWLFAACGDDEHRDEADAAPTVDAAPDATPAVDAAPDATPEQFDLDVVVLPDRVQVWMSGAYDQACAPMDTYPQPGACADLGDVSSCGRALCLERVAIERGGVELATASLAGSWWHVLDVTVPDRFAGGDVELVIEGCGGALRTPLGRAGAASPPVLTALTAAASWVYGTTSGATGATDIITTGYTPINGWVCREAGAASLRMVLPERPWISPLAVGAIAARPTVTTPWGIARISLETPADQDFVVVVPRANEAWEIGVPLPVTTVTVDGGAPTPRSARLGSRPTSAGRRLSLTASGPDAFGYTAGDTMDTLALSLADGRYTGTFAHVAPANDLELAPGDPVGVALTVGPVTLTHETDPARTHVVTLSLDWRALIVASPAP